MINLKIEKVPISSIKEYEKNPKKHSKRQITNLAKAIKQYKYDQPIVVNKNFEIIKGHARFLALKKLGVKEVEVIIRDDLNFVQEKALRILDNKSVSLEYDDELLQEEVSLFIEDFDPSILDFSYDLVEALLNSFDLNEEEVYITKEEFSSPYKSNNTDENDSQKDREENNVVFVDYIGLDNRNRLNYVFPKPKEKVLESNISLVEYLSSFEKIFISLSGGKDSLSTLLWCLSNLPKEKLICYHIFSGWNVEWSENLFYVFYLVKKYDLPLLINSDFEKTHEQFLDLFNISGFPSVANNCWLGAFKRKLKTDLFKSNKLFNSNIIIDILSVRQEEVEFGGTQYFQSGFMEYEGNRLIYISPIFNWLLDDVNNFISNFSEKISPIYNITSRNSCIVCPQKHNYYFSILKSLEKERFFQWMYLLENTKKDLSFSHIEKFFFIQESSEQDSHFFSKDLIFSYNEFCDLLKIDKDVFKYNWFRNQKEILSIISDNLKEVKIYE